jgi:ABC-2 type transport system permease protein
MRFYLTLYRMALLSRAEYRVDFAVGVLTAISMQLAAFAFFWVVMTHAPGLGGWTSGQVLALFGLTAIILSLSEAFFNGIWWLPWYVLDGQLDRLLVYPVRSLLFVLLSRPELHSLGNFVTGVATLGIAWSMMGAPLAALALVPLWVVSGAVIYTAGLVIMGSATLKVTGPWTLHMLAIHHLLNASRYPASIYPRWLGALILFVLPFGAAIFFPVSWLRGDGSLAVAVLAPPLAATVMTLVAFRTWDFALRTYQSTGS